MDMNYEVRILRYKGLGFMAKVYEVTPSGNVTDTILYHGEYHATAQEALSRAQSHIERNTTGDFR